MKSVEKLTHFTLILSSSQMIHQKNKGTYLLSTNHQKYHQIYDDYGLLDNNLQFDMVSPPLQFDEQYPTMVPLCDPTKDMTNSNSTTPLASLEILKSYGKGFKRL
ncbi:hypothetical protein GmHk_09G024663 [Glycine max]|nr:hypothetical protein GmHk_09G024663 [Glycine max]